MLEQLPSWVHIGIAKGASSALQKHYFATHPELTSLGLGYQQENISWYSPEIQIALEVDLRCRATHLYDAQSIYNTYWSHVHRLWNNNQRYIGFSYENLSCSLGHDVSIAEKAYRLHQLLGTNTQIIYVVRDQITLLQSLYKELLLWGLPVPFDIWIERLIFTNFQGIISDLQYAEVIDTYAQLFGRDKMHIISFSQLQQNTSPTLHALSTFLQISHSIDALPTTHSGLTNIQAAWLLKQNQIHVHDFGRDRFAIWHGQRLHNFGRSQWSDWQPSEIIENQQLGIESAKLARQIEEGPTIEFNLSKHIREKLHHCFYKSNQRLFDCYGVLFEDSVLQHE